MAQAKRPPPLGSSTLIVTLLVLGLVLAAMLAAGLAATLDLSAS
jgi:hypothetical protein